MWYLDPDGGRLPVDYYETISDSPCFTRDGPRVIGRSSAVVKKCTCYNCGAIIEYLPKHVRNTDRKDEGTTIRGLPCPECGDFIRTNP